MNYAHSCTCGGKAEWNGRNGYQCSSCDKTVGTTGGQLFSLLHWNLQNPAREGEMETPDLSWEWPVMGGWVKGYMYCVVSKGDTLIHPITGATLDYPHSVNKFVCPEGRYWICLSASTSYSKKKLLKDLKKFCPEFFND